MRLFPTSAERLTRHHVLATYSIATGALAGILGLLLAGCGGGGPHRDLQVMAYSPQGSIEKAELVEIKFDKPVVEDALVGKAAAAGSVEITPAIPWKGYWQDRQTLAIEPTDALAPSTRYRVALAGELARRTGGFELSFVHRPLAVEGVWGVDAEALDPQGDVPLSFNQPVRASEAAAHCKLSGDGGETALLAPGDATASANVSLHPQRPLTPAAIYTITCSGLTGAGGNAPLDKPYLLAVKARPPLAITKITPAGTDVGADEVTLSFTFSTPVTLDAARKAVTSKPPIRALDQGYLSGDGKEYKATADLETDTDYTITVAGLTDTFGQPLGKPEIHTFRTGDASPRLSMERGIFALEASAHGYPVWSRNIHKFEVECAQIPRAKLVLALTTDMNYDPWGGNNDDAPIDWKALAAKPKTTPFSSVAKNKWVLEELELGKTCGGAPGARGVYLAEVRSNDIKLDPSRSWWNPRKNRVLANVTDLGVLIKTGTASGLVWVTSLATGSPIAGAKVSVYTPEGKQVWVEVTSADGLVKIPGQRAAQAAAGARAGPPGEGEDWDSYRSQRLIAIVEKAGDLAVVDGNWSNGIQIWNFGVPEDRHGGVTKIRGFIQSDRGLYRPGETVHFKGLVREIAQGMPPRVPSKQKVAIEVQDSRGQSVLTTTAKLSAFGGFAFDMTLGERRRSATTTCAPRSRIRCSARSSPSRSSGPRPTRSRSPPRRSLRAPASA